MEAQMTAPAEGDVPGRFLRPGPAMVDDQALESQTHLTATVAAQHRFAMPAKQAHGVPLPVIATPAQTEGEQVRAAARPAPPDRLPSLHTSLPGPSERARIHASGKPLSTAAPHSFPSSQPALKAGSCGRTQTPGKSNAKSAASTRSASSGRCLLYKEATRAERTWSRGETDSIAQGSII